MTLINASQMVLLQDGDMGCNLQFIFVLQPCMIICRTVENHWCKWQVCFSYWQKSNYTYIGENDFVKLPSKSIFISKMAIIFFLMFFHFNALFFCPLEIVNIQLKSRLLKKKKNAFFYKLLTAHICHKDIDTFLHIVLSLQQQQRI